ncbi:MAG: FAD:protein FMN transferase [Ginsengibacter sp.]
MFRHLYIFKFFLLINYYSYAQPNRFSFSQPKMGSPFNIIFYYGDSLQANAIAKECFALVDSFVTIYSDYLDSSELNRLCAKAGTADNSSTVSPPLFDILLISKMAYEKSEGTFDITLGPLTKMWRKARKEKLFPSPGTVKEKLGLTGFRNIKIDTVTHKIQLLETGMQLDLGGIAQGYIAQQVMDFLKTRNVVNALVDVSGDIVAVGAPPGTSGWSVGINVPEQTDELQKKTLLITNKSVTTSGDVYQYMEHNGRRYSHIINPRTGYGITSQKNVTVIAGDGTTADWLTKACSILPVRKAKKLAHSLKAEVLIAELRKSKVIYYKSRGFGQYWKGG